MSTPRRRVANANLPSSNSAPPTSWSPQGGLGRRWQRAGRNVQSGERHRNSAFQSGFLLPVLTVFAAAGKANRRNRGVRRRFLHRRIVPPRERAAGNPAPSASVRLRARARRVFRQRRRSWKERSRYPSSRVARQTTGTVCFWPENKAPSGVTTTLKIWSKLGS